MTVGLFYDKETGGKRMRAKWSAELSELLKTYYPYTTNQETADILGISLRTVIYRAKKLGLTKACNPLTMKRRKFIIDNFQKMSHQAMAKHLGISKVHVFRIANSINLIRSYDEKCRIMAMTRETLVRRERRRLIFGLPPVSEIKIVSNRKRINTRYRMKKKGYIQSDDPYILFYSSEEMRDFKCETSAIKLGFKFLPLTTDRNSDSEI